jgi:hypothetical protein
LLVRRGVLGKSTFEYSGTPTALAWGPEKTVLAVGSHFHPVGWSGYTIERLEGCYRVALYDAQSLKCLTATDTIRSPVNDLAFHPTLPLLAIGTGRYDGGCFFGGDLVLWDFQRQKIGGVLTSSRMVVSCAFSGAGNALELGLRPVTDDDFEGDAQEIVLEGRAERGSWPTDERWLEVDSLSLRLKREPNRTEDLSVEQKRLAEQIGLRWEQRLRAWGIGWAGGDIVSCGARLAFERWSPDGERVARLDDPLDGVQLAVSGDHALVSFYRLDLARRELASEGALTRIDLRTNQRQDVAGIDYPVAMASDSHGNVLLREASIPPRQRPQRDHVLAGDGTLEHLDLGEYDCFNHYLPAFDADGLYAIQTWPERKKPMDPIKKWLCAVDATPLEIKRLFPHEWNSERKAHLFSHGGCYVEYKDVRALLLLTTVHHYDALHPVEGLVTLRELPEGRARWEQPVTTEMSWAGFMPEAGVVIVATADLRLLVYAVETGDLLQEEFASTPHTGQIVLSGAVNGRRVAFGTIDGSILVYEWG